MRTLEKILWILFCIGLIGKAYLINGEALLLFLSLILLSIQYSFFSVFLFGNVTFRTALNKNAFDNLSRRQIIGLIYCGIGFSIVLTGALYKLLEWDYSLY